RLENSFNQYEFLTITTRMDINNGPSQSKNVQSMSNHQPVTQISRDMDIAHKNVTRSYHQHINEIDLDVLIWLKRSYQNTKLFFCKYTCMFEIHYREFHNTYINVILVHYVV